MTPREQILATVRRSLGVTGAETPRLKAVQDRLSGRPRGVLPARATSKSEAGRKVLFVEMAEASAATVSVVGAAEEAPLAIADFLRGRNLALRLRRGSDDRLSALPWDAAAIEVTTGRSYGDDETAVSAAFGGVAETGTLALVSGPENPSTLNLLPDNHIVVLDAADIAATYEDVWSRVRERYGNGSMPRTVNWITGPSRSADIEQILLMGAHGPRRLHIVLIDPSHQAEAGVAGEAVSPGGSTPAPVEIRSTLREDRDASENAEAEEASPAIDPPSSTKP